jgi:flavin reductase
MPTASHFKQGMRRLAAGVSVVTAIDGGVPHGFLATSVTSISAEPRPSLLVSANRRSATGARIQRSGAFCVNVLAEDCAALARRFSSSAADRFVGCEWVALATGSPAITCSLVSFDCRLTRTLEVHSHTILIGDVEAVRIWREDARPLVHFGGRFRALGADVEDPPDP